MSTFKIGFDGPSVENGEIDVADLAPALLALGELFSAANQALNQDRAEAKLRIRASEKGSFVALLSLDVSFVTDLLDMVAAYPDRVTAADQLLDLLIKGGGALATGTVGLFGALRFLRGKRPDKTEKNGNGTTSITVGPTTIVVDQRTVVLLEDYRTREATEKFVGTALNAKGINKVSFDEEPDGTPELILTKDDIAAVKVPEPEDDDKTETTTKREALVKIVSAQFAEGYLWRFTDGTNTFTASMEDQDFLNRLDRSEVVLSKNDTLRCEIEETQTLAGNKLKTDAKILEVKEHISGARQLKLL
ncbi:hypothetical protein [Paracoccus marinaquae]|uniref:Phage tail protein n=1 Tax=Paracoccus marinaquae TaxID=2841926 RepID=A0ABS6AGA2_9RHOB|nr:hypothetical protein [Paracoccus marinaquae]MBU3028987.1 hypothetical protein [Paracoccus marinaquae]